jgi:hypothetical protein
MRYCTYCGATFASSMTRCPQCGQAAVTTPVTPQIPATPFAPPTPYPAFPATSETSLQNHPANAAPPLQPGVTERQSYATYDRAALPAQSPLPPSLHQAAATQQHTASTNPGATRYSIRTATLPPPPPRPASPWLVSIVISLTLLLVASGVVLLYYADVSRPQQIRAQATATMYQYHTSVAQATHSAQQQATATTVAQNRAQATANAQATVQAKATASAFQNVLVQSTHGTPTLATPLTFEDGPNWDIYPTQDGGGCAFTGNALHSSVFQANYYTPCIAHNTSYQNFALEIQLSFLKGDEGGVIIRSDTNGNNFYSFRIRRSDRTYAFVLTSDNGHATPLVNGNSTLIQTGINQLNTLSLVARDSTFYLYINHQYVGSISDDTFRTGSLGVIALDRKNATDIAFTNLRVWKLA